MLGKHCVSDLELAAVKIPTQLPWGAEQFQTTLQAPISDSVTLKRRQLALFALRHKDATDVCNTLREHLNSLHSATPLVDELESPLDPRVQESYEQIYWGTTSMGAPFNAMRYIIPVLVFWKTLVLPSLAVLVPLMALVIPFFLLRYIHEVNITASGYMAHLRQVVLQQITIPAILRAKHSGDFVGHMLETGFIALTAITYISGIWSQVTSAMHLRKIALGVHEKGDIIAGLLGRFVGILDSLHSLPDVLQTALRPFILRGEKIRADLSEIPTEGGYRTYGYLWNHRDQTGEPSLGQFKTWMGELDAMLGIVGLSDICFPRYTGPLYIEGVYHPGLEAHQANTVSWSSANGAILTGPNRGGKSTLCRAIGVSIVCAQSWGFAFARRMSCRPFEHMETALHPADTLGEMSLFEAEIEFAKDVLAGKGSMFVMMDEIFHSTNARDGLAASRVFLNQLYAKADVTSLISTHYKELPEEFEEKAQAWAMDAEEGEKGLLKYTYKMIAGISEKSSVMEILRERGLLTS